MPKLWMWVEVARLWHWCCGSKHNFTTYFAKKVLGRFVDCGNAQLVILLSRYLSNLKVVSISPVLFSEFLNLYVRKSSRIAWSCRVSVLYFFHRTCQLLFFPCKTVPWQHVRLLLLLFMEHHYKTGVVNP